MINPNQEACCDECQSQGWWLGCGNHANPLVTAWLKADYAEMDSIYEKYYYAQSRRDEEEKTRLSQEAGRLFHTYLAEKRADLAEKAADIVAAAIENAYVVPKPLDKAEAIEVKIPVTI